MLSTVLSGAFPINISDALKHGIAGLGAIMAVLCFLLLRSEQKKSAPRRSIMVAIYIFMAFSFLLVVLGMLSSPEAATAVKTYFTYVVPHSEKKQVKELPKETSGKYMLMKDISIFDLRGWKPFPIEKKNVEKISPANYINYLHVKKTLPLDSLNIHYATSGYDIDLRCITQNYTVYQADTTTNEHPGMKNYGIAVDVSNIPIGEEFLVVIEATYWNGFSDLLKENASTYTDDEITGLDELDLIILLPYDKPIKEATRWNRKDDSKNNPFTEYRDVDKFYIDKNKRFVYWGIKNIKPEMHYKLNWTW